MDGRAFDDITRTLAAGASRRRVLAGLAGAALGALGLGRARAAQTDATGLACGGITGSPCPPNFVCVDDAGDSCDPLNGGADCSGVCQPVPTSNCAAILCIEGSTCCENCGGICVPAGTPCSDALCGDPGAVPCNQVLCGPGEYCCNESCSICAPIGGACTEQFCGPEEPCGNAVCGAGEFCCNPSCSICAPLGGACTQQVCDETCSGNGQACTTSANGCCPDLTCSAPADPANGVCQPILVGPPVCRADADCAAGITDPCTGATCDNGQCSVFIVDCAPGFVCCGNGRCCPTECQTDADCPDDGCNLVACSDGQCISTLRACACAAEGQACGDTVAECCDGLACRPSDQGGRVCVPRRGQTTPTPGPTATPKPNPAPTATPRPSPGGGPAPTAVVPAIRPPTGTSSGVAAAPRSTGTGATSVRALPNTGVAPTTARSSGAWAAALALGAAAAAAVAERVRPDAGGQDRPAG